MIILSVCIINQNDSTNQKSLKKITFTQRAHAVFSYLKYSLSKIVHRRQKRRLKRRKRRGGSIDVTGARSIERHHR